MFSRKRVSFSDCVSTFGDNPNSYKSKSKAGASGELRLPLHTLKLLMRKCQVRLTRWDDVNVAGKLRRRSNEPAKSSRSEKVFKDQRKYVTSLCSLKREVADLEGKENWPEIDANLLVPQVKIEAAEEEDEHFKPSFCRLMFNTKPCHVKLSRCDEEVRDIKPEVKLKQEVEPTFWALRNCQVVLSRCDAGKIEGKGVVRRTVARNRKRIKIELVPCYLCEKLVNSSYMYRHLNKHTGEKPYKCSVCPDKAYLFQSELRSHMKRQGHVIVATSGETTCTKKRSQSKLTKRSSGHHHHLSIKREREQAPEVPKKTKSRSSSSKAKKKPTCDICGRSFARNRGLIYHVRAKHTGERPYSCPKCDQRFFDAYSRNWHVKTKH